MMSLEEFKLHNHSIAQFPGQATPGWCPDICLDPYHQRSLHSYQLASSSSTLNPDNLINHDFQSRFALCHSLRALQLCGNSAAGLLDADVQKLDSPQRKSTDSSQYARATPTECVRGCAAPSSKTSAQLHSLAGRFQNRSKTGAFGRLNMRCSKTVKFSGSCSLPSCLTASYSSRPPELPLSQSALQSIFAAAHDQLLSQLVFPSNRMPSSQLQ